jgi:dolichyl-phosphate beta-glucosyltransferase
LARTFLAVVIPAYNEEERLSPTLDAICDHLAKQSYTWQIVVVSDGSKDATQSIVKAKSQAEPRVTLDDSQPNRGKGYVVRRGILQVDADWVLFSDADLATPIEELDKLMAKTKEGKVIIGSRPLRESQLEVRQPLWREWGGRIFNKFIQAVGVWGIKDTQCGFKLFSQKAAKDIFGRAKLDGWGFDFETMMIARDLGYEIIEVGVRWRHMEGSKFEPMKEAPKMLKQLFALRLAGKKKRISPNPEAQQLSPKG